jgi:hypothetical protein
MWIYTHPFNFATQDILERRWVYIWDAFPEDSVPEGLCSHFFMYEQSRVPDEPRILGEKTKARYNIGERYSKYNCRTTSRLAPSPYC